MSVPNFTDRVFVEIFQSGANSVWPSVEPLPAWLKKQKQVRVKSVMEQLSGLASGLK